MSGHDAFIGLSGPDFDFPIELGEEREFAAALHAFQPEFNEGRRPLMFPTLPIVGGYLWGCMIEEARGAPLARLGMDGAFAFDGEQAFPTSFGIGMYHAGLLANHAVRWLPPTALTRFAPRFLKTTWPGDVIAYHGEIEALERRGAETVIRTALAADRTTDGAAIIAASAEFVLR